MNNLMKTNFNKQIGEQNKMNATAKCLGREFQIEKLLKAEIENISNALWNIQHLAQFSKELTNRLENGEVKETLHSTTMMMFGNAVILSPEVIESREKLIAELPQTINKQNYEEVLTKLKTWFTANIGIRDERKTLEVLQAEEKNHQAYLKREAQKKAEQEAERTRLANENKLVKIEAGQMAITLVITRDDSDLMTDYFHDHVTVKTWILGVVKEQPRTESLARLFMPSSLQSLDWKWHTENYSMGHGNYLRSNWIENLAGEKNGTYEIQFVKYYSGYRGEFEKHEEYKDFNNTQESGNVSVSVKRNLEHDGVEVRFPSKPSEGIIMKLKSNGFRWSKRGFWYAKYSEDKLRIAESLTA